MKALIQKYLTNITGLQLFQLLRFTALFLTGVLLAKSHLSTAQIGIYETLMLVAGVAGFFWISGLVQTLLAVYKQKSEADQRKLFFNAYLIMQVCSLVVFLLFRWLAGAMADFTNSPDILNYTEIFSWFLLLNFPAYLAEYIYLLKDQPRHLVAYGIVSYLMQLLFVAGPVLLGYDLQFAFYGLVLIAALRFLWLFVLLLRNAEFSFSSVLIKEHLSLATPLILSTLLSGSGEYIDGFIVTRFFSEADLAVFRYGAKELPLVLLLANAFSNAMVPQLSENGKFEDALNRLKSNSRKMMHALFPVTIVLMLFSHWLYPLFFNQDFAISASVFNIYLLLIISRLIFPQTIVIARRKTKIMVVASAVEIALNVSLSLLLLQYFGLLGIAVATIVSSFIEKLTLAVYNEISLKISWKNYIAWKPLFAYAVVLILLFVVVELYIF